MAENYLIRGYDGSGWNIDFAASDYIAFCGADYGDKISVGGWNSSSHKSNVGITSDGCATDHVRNCKYVSSSEVSLMEATEVELNTTNVATTDCTLRFSYQDDVTSTSLSNVYFYAFDGVDITTAPSGVTVCAFERASSAINTDRVSDSGGEGYGWNSSYGIDGYANALVCSDQGSASWHHFYFGVSVSPTSKGSKSLTFRIEWEVS